MKHPRLLLCSLILLGASQSLRLLAQQTLITYEGYLIDRNAPGQGAYDFRFTLYAVAANGTSLADPIITEDLAVERGRFQARLDFGEAVFNGDPRWLEIAVRPGADDGAFTVLEPRQQLTATPYAIHALRAAGVVQGAITGAGVAPGSLNASHLLAPAGPQPGQMLSYDGTSFLWTAPPSGGDGVFSLDGTTAYYLAGNVGIGTSVPRGKLHLYDPANSVSHVLETGGGINTWTKLEFANGNGQWSVGTSRGFVGDMFYIHRESSPNITFGVYPNGDVHYQGRLSRLDVGEDFAANLRTAELLLGHTNRRGSPGRALVDFGSSLVVNFGNDWGTTIIGSGVTMLQSYDLMLGHPSRRGSPGRALVDFGSSLVVNFGNDWGTTVIGGGVTEVRTLRITGGADLAEPFALSEKDVQPGDVVVIDEKKPGQLKLCTQAYDTRVAGIVSGANGVSPGISLHQEGVIEGSQNVALTGRVYAHADASNGPIQPGDLLTTSDTPGHAMKVTDRTRAQGAILGKAMSGLAEGKGMVLVLVTLQ